MSDNLVRRSWLLLEDCAAANCPITSWVASDDGWTLTIKRATEKRTDNAPHDMPYAFWLGAEGLSA